MNQSLGAYYQCYKNKKSFESAIVSFREYYPDSSVFVSSDSGYDYSDFCKRHACEFKMNSKLQTHKNLVFTAVNSILEFIDRLWEGFHSIKESHCLLLEDDVRVLKHHTKPFKYSINGCNMGEFLPHAMQCTLREKEYAGPMYFGGCGGSVLDLTFFKALPVDSVKELVLELPKGEYASDQLLSYIALATGGTIGPYDEFAEMWYPTISARLSDNTVAFLHQYKNDYDLL